MRALLLLLGLLGTNAFAESGLPFFSLCTSPPCACGANSCGCGEICSLDQCRPAQMGYCSFDSQCGTGACGTFVCNFNVCVVTDGGVRSDAGVQGEADGGVESPPRQQGCSTVPGAFALGPLVWAVLRSFRRRR